jgi:ANTAR domain
MRLLLAAIQERHRHGGRGQRVASAPRSCCGPNVTLTVANFSIRKRRFRQIQALLLGTETIQDFLTELAGLAILAVGKGLSCGITLQPNGRPLTVASTDALAAQVDEVQYGLDQGPCLHAMRTGTLVSSLASRAVIDQAIGVLMGQRRITAAEAFAILRTTSQNRNIKLRAFAAQIVEGAGALPPLPPPFDPPR